MYFRTFSLVSAVICFQNTRPRSFAIIIASCGAGLGNVFLGQCAVLVSLQRPEKAKKSLKSPGTHLTQNNGCHGMVMVLHVVLNKNSL